MLCAAMSINAQVKNFPSELTGRIRTETITMLSVMLKDYVYPEVGLEVSNILTRNLNEGRYDDITDFNAFAQIVTNDLFELTRDKHLMIRFDPEDVNEIKNGENISAKEREDYFIRQKENSGKRNHGFREVRILPGNIAFLRFDEFERAEFASKTAYAAMEFISNADAIIIDLRSNTGGWGSMVQLILSYFFDFQDEKKNIIFFEKKLPYKNEVIQYRNLPDLPGKRILETPLYILTSGNTYSAAEAFTDVLKNRNRAIIIGETTRGGAHSTRGPEILTDYYIVKMPISEVLNSQTKKNWEGTGIEPDIKTNRKFALDTALIKIYTEVLLPEANENYLNNLGYSLLNEDMNNIAILVFKENIKRNPRSANCYDSLGEAYMKNGDIERAIKNYQKSLELNSNNNNAREQLDKLKQRNIL